MLKGYTVHEELYKSQRRIVHRGVRDSDQAPVIIKSFLVGMATEEDVAAVKHEFDILAALSVNGVPRSYGLIPNANAFDLIFEDRGGSTLHDYIRSSSFDLEARLLIALGIVDVLEGVHGQHVVHRDINPANVLVDSTGGVTLIDFSIATRQAEDHIPVSHPRGLEGTLPYLSPEQTGRMNRPVDYRSDFYSLGITLFELFSGRLPFQAVDPMELVYHHIAMPAPQLAEIRQDVPHSLSEVISKLLEKAPEDRYQSALGIKHDLRSCSGSLQDDSEEFRLGRQDVRDRFSIPKKLYGRQIEVQTLMTAFERAGQGGVELVLVSGHSGIGKSALVQAVQAPVTERHGYFISGKFDQLRLTVPYSAFVTALKDLVAQLLTESDEALMAWKDNLLQALDGNGQLVIDVIPEVKHILGPQPAIPELNPSESRNRFKFVFRNFIRVFCQLEHPLVIFLDDLQWVDPASLALIDTILTDDDSHHLLLVGAYRDNEVDASHPLTAAVNALVSEERLRVSQLAIDPLNSDSLTQLLSDTLHGDREEIDRLQLLLLDKTAGNPFFLKQVLTTLYRQESITFDYSLNRWVWNTEELEAMNITNNVVDLMVNRLNELPQETIQALRLAACIGSRFDLITLELISTGRKNNVFDQLKPALEAGLVIWDRNQSSRQNSASAKTKRQRLGFLHDRVQQAAYEMLSEELKKEIHLQIGLQLQASIPDVAQSERVFEVVDHLNVGHDLLVDQSKRRELATLNLEAARRAVSATAYGAGCDYVVAGMALLPSDCWKTDYELTRDLHRVQVDAEYLRGDFELSQGLINTMLQKLHTPAEQAEVQSVLVIQQTMGGHYRQAIMTCCEALAKLNVNMPTGDLGVALREELDRYSEALDGRDVPSLLHSPEVTSHEVAIALRLLANILPLCYIADPPLRLVATTKIVNLSLTHGHTPDSATGYAFFGLLQSSALHNYSEAYRFGQLAMALSDKYSDASQMCRTTHMFCTSINHWSRHLREFDAINRRGFQAGLQSGELQFAGYHRYNRALCLFHLGTNLKELVPELEDLIRFGRKTQNQHATDPVVAVMRATLDLAGETPEPGSFLFEHIHDSEFLEDLGARAAMPTIAHYNIIKSQVLYLYGQIDEAKICSEKAAEALSFISGHVATANHEFYAALIDVAALEAAPQEFNSARMEPLKRRQRQLQQWADSCPDNFLHKSLLLSAEIARLEGEGWRAAELYDRAIEEAGRSGYLQEEALARERAGLFWLSQNRRKIASVYLSEAHHGYQLWGSPRKARLLVQGQAGLIAGTSMSTKTSSSTSMPFLTLVSSTGAALDFAMVMKASRTISREVDLDGLVKKLIRIAVETAGAQRGYLLLVRTGTLLIEASSTFDQGEIRYRPAIEIGSSEDVPASIVNYVNRTKEILTIADAAEDPRFSGDPVVRRLRPRSVLCVPITSRSDAVGVLYLVHDLASEVFTADRVEILQSLTAQATISLENAGLYEERKRSERELREALEELQRLKNRLEQENVYLHEEMNADQGFGDLVGRSDVLRSVVRQIEHVAPTNASVLILGESGTGKELVAREIHKRSDRQTRPLIRVNCASIPKELYESEFFGHVKGAFTGALKDRAGRFELADEGTLFLDEVGEIPLELQNKLLRVLQEQQYERVGDDRTRQVDVRIIAATNRDLRQEVESGRFRKDLYYRLNVYPIEIPPLRSRKEDIPLLASHLLDLAARKFNCGQLGLTQAHAVTLQGYDWPGNVRELQNMIERAVITSRGNALQFDLPDLEPPPESLPPSATNPKTTFVMEVISEAEKPQRERENILAALRRSHWKVGGPGGAAELLGVKPTTLHSRIKKMDLKKPN